MSLFITFEGVEGSGKTTQIKMLNDVLILRGYKTLMTREPGGTPISDEIRRIVLNSAHSDMVPPCELFLYAASRAQHVSQMIKPALQANKIVLCDRFTDSTVAYQGYGRRLPLSIIQQLNRVASHGQVPDLTLFLDVPVAKGLAQAKAKKKRHDRLERAGAAFHGRVRAGFRQLAKKEPRRFRHILQQPTVEETQTLVRAAVDSFLR